jgi:hypothetical protein
MNISQSVHPRNFNTLIISFITRLSTRKTLIIFAINIIMLFLINSGGSFSALANSSVTSALSHKGTLFSDTVVAKEYKTAKLKENAEPFIKLISPRGGEVWEEGKAYEIRWESQGVDEVYIGVAVGGKDKGLLYSKGSSKIDAEGGKISWKIPKRFITGFGPAKSDLVRIMIFDTRNSTIRDLSGYFTIEGRTDTAETSPSEYKNLRSQGQD